MEARRICDRYHSDIEVDRNTLTLSRLPVHEERSIMSARLTALTSSLRPTSYSVGGMDAAGKALSEMFTKGAWPNLKVADAATARKMVTAYLANLEVYPFWAITAVCQAVSSGKVDDLNPDYPPSAARLAQLCDQKIADMVAEKARFAKVLGIKQVRTTVDSPEVREAARLRHEAWKAEQEDPSKEIHDKAEAKLLQDLRLGSEKSIIADYAARGMQPIRTESGILVSPSLIKNIQEKAKADARLGKRKDKDK
jgi:hypothetical protein